MCVMDFTYSKKFDGSLLYCMILYYNTYYKPPASTYDHRYYVVFYYNYKTYIIFKLSNKFNSFSSDTVLDESEEKKYLG